MERCRGHTVATLTLYNLTLVCIFSKLSFIHFQGCKQREFVSQSRAALVGDHFLYSQYLYVLIQGWYCEEKLDISHSRLDCKQTWTYKLRFETCSCNHTSLRFVFDLCSHKWTIFQQGPLISIVLQTWIQVSRSNLTYKRHGDA